MPGYVMHLVVAERLLDMCHITEDEARNKLRLGSIVPDTRKGNEKRRSHFWSDEEYARFVRKPDLQMFLEKYGERLSEPYIFGYYSHLYMDYRFVTEYWPLHYMFYDKSMQQSDVYDEVEWVRYMDTGACIARQVFFSEQYYYGDYSRMNHYMIQHYGIETPRYQPDIFRTGGVEEAAEASAYILQDMLSFLARAADEGDAERQPTAEEVQRTLKAFSLSGLQQLIDQTARQLSDIY